MFKNLIRKIDDFKVTRFIKRMKKTHEKIGIDTFSNYAIDFDYSSYIDFNKELRVRELVLAKRKAQAKLNEFSNKEPVPICEIINYTGECNLNDIDDSKLIISDEERKMACATILVGMDEGLIDKLTLERTE